MEQTQTPPLTPSADQQRQMNEARTIVARMKESNIAPATIYDILVKKGIEPSIAVMAIESTPAGPSNSQNRSDGGRDMLIGGLWIAGGLIVTIGTYMSASESGGHYYITYGPVIYGVIRFFKGVSKMG